MKQFTGILSFFLTKNGYKTLEIICEDDLLFLFFLILKVSYFLESVWMLQTEESETQRHLFIDHMHAILQFVINQVTCFIFLFFKSWKVTFI